MVWLYIAIILCMRVVQHTFVKANSKSVPSNAVGYLKYTAFYQGVAGLFAVGLFLIELIGGIDELYFWETALYAGISGIALSVACCCSLYSLSTGTMSLTSIFGTAGLLVPTIASMFMYGEYLTVLQWISIAVFMVGAYLLMGDSKATYGKFSLSQFLVLFLSLLMNGVTMLMQTMFGREIPNGNVSLFSALSFGIGVIVLVVLYAVFLLLSKKKIKAQGEMDTEEKGFKLFAENKKEMSLSKKVYLFATFLAVAVFLINQLATISTPLISPVILFAFINGGSTIISAIVGAIMYKEKLSLKTVLGVILGVGALVCIKLFAN